MLAKAMADPSAPSAAALGALVVGQRGYTPLGLLMRAVRALLPPQALVLASSLAHGPVERFLRAHNPERLLRFLPRLDDRVASLGRIEFRSDATLSNSILLSDQDADVLSSAWCAERGLLGFAEPVRHKLRRVDTLFGSAVSPWQRVDAIMVAESTERVLEVLGGSTAVLASDQPLVLVSIDGGPATAGIQALLEAAGYVVLDQNLWSRRPRDFGAAQAATFGEWVLALPREALHTTVDAVFPDHARLSDVRVADVDAWNTMLQEVTMREARTGGMLFEPYAGSGTFNMALDTEVACWGFYSPEGDAGQGWSWIGPRPVAGMLLPAPDRPLASIRLYAAAASSPRNAGSLVATIDREPTRVRCEWSHGYGIIDIHPTRPASAWRAIHCLELRCPETRRMHDDDPRLLALSLSSVTVSTTAS